MSTRCGASSSNDTAYLSPSVGSALLRGDRYAHTVTAPAESRLTLYSSRAAPARRPARRRHRPRASSRRPSARCRDPPPATTRPTARAVVSRVDRHIAARLDEPLQPAPIPARRFSATACDRAPSPRARHRQRHPYGPSGARRQSTRTSTRTCCLDPPPRPVHHQPRHRRLDPVRERRRAAVEHLDVLPGPALVRAERRQHRRPARRRRPPLVRSRRSPTPISAAAGTSIRCTAGNTSSGRATLSCSGCCQGAFGPVPVHVAVADLAAGSGSPSISRRPARCCSSAASPGRRRSRASRPSARSLVAARPCAAYRMLVNSARAQRVQVRRRLHRVADELVVGVLLGRRQPPPDPLGLAAPAAATPRSTRSISR